MVLRAFTNCEVGDLYQVKGKLKQTAYHTILKHHMIQLTMHLVGHGFVLMQDPKHTSKLCQRYNKSKQGQHTLQILSWLAQSVDLNLIELVWDELDGKVRPRQPTNVSYLWHILQKSGPELSSVYLQCLG